MKWWQTQSKHDLSTDWEGGVEAGEFFHLLPRMTLTEVTLCNNVVKSSPLVTEL